MINDIAGAMRERQALQEARDIARGKNNSGQTPQGGIGVDANGVYGVPSQPSGSIGVDANGMYGVEQPEGKIPLTWGDFSGKMSALGNLGNLATISGLDVANSIFGKNKESDSGMNMSHTPQQNGFGTAISNAENPLNSFSGGSILNFLNPVSSGNLARVDGGAVKQGANDYLDDRYSRLNYLRDRINAGSRNPFVSATVYDTLIAPLREQAREDEIRNAFAIINDSRYDGTPERDAAIAKLSYYTKNADLAGDLAWKKRQREIEEENHAMNVARFEAARERGFASPRSPGRPRSSESTSTSRTRRTRFKPSVPTFDGILSNLYGVPDSGSSILLGATRGVKSNTGANRRDTEARLNNRIGAYGVYMNPYDPEHYMEEADNYIVPNESEKPEYDSIADWAKSEDAKKPLFAGKFPIFDTERGVIQGFFHNAMEENKKSKEEYREKQLRKLKSTRSH